MSTLHLINRSPFSTSILQELADAVSEGDHVLLIEDGVYAASGTTSRVLPEDIELWALEEDCTSRGVTPTSDTVGTLGMAGFVALTASTDRTVSWF
ncbi:sulfurtransferase complex subunit TusB [Kushneria indalinina]|uniref:tRNA 2-thiouridine synthesizing protein B n=1 Tax=Kushneria indalinina DSM 14324 TaxID=1122140 RepID=A0A3D9DZG5_9GAMM|nr:sulfurtransferase complex subunit TusB [Kushneria indalinina]REC96200.1 tRNA 2-thiouridine synthesizing protein B [Kushneria indalinina DSM 14324]